MPPVLPFAVLPQDTLTLEFDSMPVLPTSVMVLASDVAVWFHMLRQTVPGSSRAPCYQRDLLIFC